METFADTTANGIMSLKISRAPWEKGSKIGISLYTLSKLKAEIDAILPVLKNADCRNVKKKRDVRISDNVKDRNGVSELGSDVMTELIVGLLLDFVKLNTVHSSCTHVTRIIQNPI